MKKNCISLLASASVFMMSGAAYAADTKPIVNPMITTAKPMGAAANPAPAAECNKLKENLTAIHNEIKLPTLEAKLDAANKAISKLSALPKFTPADIKACQTAVNDYNKYPTAWQKKIDEVSRLLEALQTKKQNNECAGVKDLDATINYAKALLNAWKKYPASLSCPTAPAPKPPEPAPKPPEPAPKPPEPAPKPPEPEPKPPAGPVSPGGGKPPVSPGGNKQPTPTPAGTKTVPR